jgi:hypothetical protein
MVVLAYGCGQSAISVEGVQAAFIDANCTHDVACGLFPDSATCHVAYLGIDFGVDSSQIAAVKAGKVKYDASAARTCFNAIADAPCDQTAEAHRVLPPACAQVLAGTVGSGGNCVMDAECKSQSCNIPICVVTCCSGACVGDAPLVPAPVGSACGGSAGPCVSDAFCDFTGTMTCTALYGSGMACQNDSECAFGLACAGSSAPVCKTLPIVGEPCPDGRCRDDGTTCSSTTQTCVKVGLLGAACTTNTDCSHFYTCGSAGACQATPIGGSCTSDNGCFESASYCALPTAGSGTCAVPQANGDPCTNDRDCESDHCEDTLQPPVCTDPPMCT